MDTPKMRVVVKYEEAPFILEPYPRLRQAYHTYFRDLPLTKQGK